MKKIIGIVSICSFLLIGNKAFGALFTAQCVGGCSTSSSQATYSCGGNTYKDYNSYQLCVQREQAEKERLELEAKQKIFNNRNDTLSEYKDFFEEIGVNLNIDTSSEQYDQWLRELKEAKNDYIKDQENDQKIKELEERINSLESKPAVINKVVEPTKKEIKPVVNTKIEPIVKEEPKKDNTQEKVLPVIEDTTTTTQTPFVNTNKSIFRRIFDWFKSL